MSKDKVQDKEETFEEWFERTADEINDSYDDLDRKNWHKFWGWVELLDEESEK